MEPVSSNAIAPEPPPSVAAEKRDLLARLLGRLAHEIRNPLSSLDIHVQLLEEDLGRAAPAIRQQLGGRLEIIRGELTRLENIVRRFLRLASPSALEYQDVWVPDTIHHIRKLLEPQAAARQVTIVTRIDPALPALRADGDQLTQALLNLVINGLQAVESGGRIEVNAQVDSPAGVMTMEVRDTGPGVPPEKRTAVFEPYFTTKQEGSGLGLWIAQQIAVAHGGTLEVSNAPAGGAIFRLSLPLAPKELAHG